MSYKITSIRLKDELNQAELDFFEEIVKQEKNQFSNKIMSYKSTSNLNGGTFNDHLILSKMDSQFDCNGDIEDSGADFGIKPDELEDLFF